MLQEENQAINEGREPALVHQQRTDLFSFFRADPQILVRAPGKGLINNFISSSLHVQCFYLFGKKFLHDYSDLHDHLTRVKTNSHTDFLSIICSVMRWNFHPPAWHKPLLFSSSTSTLCASLLTIAKRLQRKRKNENGLETSLHSTKPNFFSDPRLLVIVFTKPLPILTRCSRGKPWMLVWE